MSKSITSTAGIDTAKATLDVAIHKHALRLHVANSASGWDQVRAALAEAGVQRVGLEATGGYERGVAAFLRGHGFTVEVLQPKQVRAFATLHLKRAKSDRIDAELIAACTHMLDEQGRMPPDARFEALGDGLTYVEQVEEDIARLKTRLEHITDKRLRRQVTADVLRLQKRRLMEIKRLIGAVCVYEDLGERYRLALSVPAVGERTALALVIRMPELGQVSREQAASLAGLAPFVHQSGKWKGQTHIGGGRGRLRRSLYAAAFPGAHHWNPALVALKTRMMGRGAAHTSAIVACARKLLIQVNAVVTRGTPWQETRPASP